MKAHPLSPALVGWVASRHGNIYAVTGADDLQICAVGPVGDAERPAMEQVVRIIENAPLMLLYLQHVMLRANAGLPIDAAAIERLIGQLTQPSPIRDTEA